MLSILGFLAVLGPLVIFHEFGHYIFARIFGVKAEIFSIGFGPVIWRRQMGETELRLSAIPLGGFVKLLGEDPETELPAELQNRALQRQAPWKRFFIFFGGPLFNFILAIFAFMLILLIGEPQMASVVGRVVHGSAAEKAGLMSGDQIVSINGKTMRKYEDVLMILNENPDRTLKFELSRKNDLGESKQLSLDVPVASETGFTQFGEQTKVGTVEGLFPTARSTQVGISNPSSPAGKAGIKTGDKLLEINGKPLKNWEELELVYAALPPNSTVKAKVEKTDGQQTRTVDFEFKKTGALAETIGLYSSELFVEKTVPKSPAETHGLKVGDRLIGIGSGKIESFFELKDAVQKSGEKEGKVIVHWERDGKHMTADITPTATATRDVLLKKTTSFTIGIMPMLVWAEPKMVVERILNPFSLVYRATERMVVFSWRNIVSLKKMFTGDVSIATLGGPILIGKLAGESISRGLIAFLTTMAVLSVGLGVLNILPVPVLDGGHLLLLGIEAIRGKPLTIRQMEIVQQVGLSLILLLMVIVIRNDLARLPFFD